MLIAENPEGHAIAYSYIRLSPDPPAGVSGDRVFEIVRFYVDGAYQGRGVGAALMQQSVDETRRRGADTVWLQVWSEAPWAIGFYERMGFSVVGAPPSFTLASRSGMITLWPGLSAELGCCAPLELSAINPTTLPPAAR